jgi:H+-transporting ATPase
MMLWTSFSPETRRTESLFVHNNSEISVTKGAVREILSWVGKKVAYESEITRQVEEFAHKGYRTIAVARSLINKERQFLGLISFQDPPRSDSIDLIKKLRSLGIEVKMLTGDSQPVAQEIAHQVGLGKIVLWEHDGQKIDWHTLDGVAEVFPETKFAIIKSAQQQKHVVGMTGDGINDAPALKRAEVGIAVFNASDAAKSAASVVLTTEGLCGIVDLVENGRSVYQRVLTWIMNKISLSVLKAGFVVSTYFLYGEFVVSSLVMILLVFLADFTKLSLAVDGVRISSKPDTWHIRSFVVLSIILGTCMMAESHLSLWLGIHYFSLGSKEGEIHTYCFLLLLFMAVFSIVSIRERKRFWSTWPNKWVIVPLLLTILLGAAIGIFGFFGLPAIGFPLTFIPLVLSAVLVLSINDAIKFALLNR